MVSIAVGDTRVCRTIGNVQIYLPQSPTVNTFYSAAPLPTIRQQGVGVYRFLTSDQNTCHLGLHRGIGNAIIRVT